MKMSSHYCASALRDYREAADDYRSEAAGTHVPELPSALYCHEVAANLPHGLDDRLN